MTERPEWQGDWPPTWRENATTPGCTCGGDCHNLAREQSEEIERLTEFVVAHTLLDKGATDFDLHAEAVERFRRAADGVEDVIRAALSEEQDG